MPLTTLFRYGLIAALVISAPMFLPHLFMEPDPAWFRMSEVVGYTGMVLAMSATVFAIRSERAATIGAYGFARGLRTGSLVALLAGLLFGLFTWVYMMTLGAKLMPALWDFYTQQLAARELPLEQLRIEQAALNEMRGLFFSPAFHGAVMAGTVLLIGLLETLIAAWALRRPAVAAHAAV